MLAAMKKIFTLVLALAFLTPSVSSAATLSQSQVNAIIALLYAFNVDQQTILSVQKALTPQSVSPTQNTQPKSTPAPATPQTTATQQNTPASTVTQSQTDLSQISKEISIQSQVCNLSQTNLKTEYLLDNLLANGNIDGRIFMNAYVLSANQGKNFYESNPTAVMTITTSDKSNDKVLNGSGATSPCGFYYPYAFYTTQKGTYTITYSALGLSKSVTINVK